MSLPRAAALLLVAALAPAAALAQRGTPVAAGHHAAPPHLTPAQIDQYGREAFEETVAYYHRAPASDWDSRVDDVIARLQKAIGLPELHLTYAIVDDSEANAGALPGGYVIVNRGMLVFIDSLTRQAAQGDEQRRAERASRFLAVVLGHELSHVILGHGIEQLERVVAEQRARAEGGIAAGHYRSLFDVADSSELADAAAVRAQELAADRLGAILLLRGGWQIQDAIDLQRAFEDHDRLQETGQSIHETTWLRSHPRSSAREAALETLRGTLKMHQSELDDALVLLNTGVDEKRALTLLDGVLADFPDLPAALHGRAVALHQLFVDAVPAQVLELRGSTPTFHAYFLPGIRQPGLPAAATKLLGQAREAYQRVLRVGEQPYSLSNLAVLDAYALDRDAAAAHAARAIALAPTDIDVRNNLGVVQFLAGETDSAAATFGAIVRERPSDAPLRVVFNYGRALAELRDPAARAVLGDYLGVESPTSPWARLARTVLATKVPKVAGAVAARHDSGAVAETPAPAVAGVRLGATGARVRALLGTPDPSPGTLDPNVLEYHGKGLAFRLDEKGNVNAMMVLDRSAGAVAGVSVGDGADAARARLGRPMDESPEQVVYAYRDWVLGLAQAYGLVSAIVVSAPGR